MRNQLWGKFTWTAIKRENQEMSHTYWERRDVQREFNDWELKQSHGLAEVGRALWIHLAQALLKQRHPEQGALAHNQESSENLQGRESTASEQSVPVLQHLHSIEVLPGVQRESPVFQFVLSWHWPVCSLHPPFRYFWTWIRSLQGSSPSWAVTHLSAFLHRKDAPVPSSSWQTYTGLFLYV